MRLRALLATAALTLAGGAGVVAAAPTAQAAGHDGYCTTATGVTVVVDFQGLGGGVVIRCATSVPAGGTGLDALRAAGVPYEGVRRWGDSFICRLYAKPSASQDMEVTNKPGYREQCIDTPPATAYWGYWHASNGGSWTYSQYGVKNRRAVAGGFEGWSFSLNRTSTSNPPPRATPRRPVTDPPAAGGSTPGGGSTGGSAGGTTGGGTTGSGSTGSGSNRPGATGSTGGRTTTPGSTSTAIASPTTPGTTTSATTAPGATSSSGPTGTAGDGLVADSDALAAEATSADTGTSTATLVGAGILAFLVVAGAGTAWRRRRE